MPHSRGHNNDGDGAGGGDDDDGFIVSISRVSCGYPHYTKSH